MVWMKLKHKQLVLEQQQPQSRKKYRVKWVGITTYMDSHNRLRVKTETFVAGSTITGDAGDDTKLPDTL